MPHSQDHARAAAYCQYLNSLVLRTLPEGLRELRTRTITATMAFDAFQEVHGDDAEKFMTDFVKNRSPEEAFSGLANAASVIPGDMWFTVMQNLMDDIEAVLESRTPDQKPEKILFGSLPTGRVNGMAVPVPGSSFNLILIDDGLFGFANLACKAIATAVPIVPGTDGRGDRVDFSARDWRKRVGDNPAIAERMYDFLVAYVLKGHPHFAKPYLPDSTHQALGAILCRSVETFIIAHEYGHCMAGHLDGSTSKPLHAIQSFGDVDGIPTSWKQEHEADLIGCDLTVNALPKERGLHYAYWGTEAFFVFAELIHRTQSMLQFGQVALHTESETHPSLQQRAGVLRAYLTKKYPEKEAQLAFYFADVIKDIAEECWNMMEGAFAAMHRDGIRPQRDWSFLRASTA